MGKDLTIYKPKKTSLAKTIVKKGIKFGVKTALHPLSIALAATPHIYRLGKGKSFKYPKFRQFDKRGRKVI